MPVMKDVLGNEIDDQDLDGFEAEGDETAPADLDEVIRSVDDGVEVPLPPEENLSRAEKKRQRGERLRDERLAREQRWDQERREAEQRQALLEQRIQMLEQERRSASRAAEPDELDSIYEEQGRLYDAYNAKVAANALTPEEAATYKKDARALQTKAIKAAVQKELQSRPQPNVGEQATRAQLQMQYPEILGNTRASAYAQGLFLQKVAMGKSNSLETVHEVMQETRKQLRLGGGHESEDSSLKRKLEGVSRGGVSQNTTKNNRIVITKEIKTMANRAFPDLPTEKDRLDHWIKTVGKDYLEELNKTSD